MRAIDAWPRRAWLTFYWPLRFVAVDLKSVRRVGSDGLLQKMHSIRNGSSTLPEIGSLLIWNPVGFCKWFPCCA